MSIENDLKDLIIKEYKTMKAFAEKVDLPYTTVDSMIKRGILTAHIDNVSKVCDLLNIDMYALANGTIQKSSMRESVLSIQEQDLLSSFRSLNPDGTAAALSYLEYLSSQPQYSKKNPLPPFLEAEA